MSFIKLCQLNANLFCFSENAPVLVFSLVPDIFLAYKCYHELLLVAMAVQRKDPLVRKQGSWAAGLPCWGVAKQGFSFIQCFFHCIFVLAQLTTRGKKNTITYPCGLNTNESTETRETSDITPMGRSHSSITVSAYPDLRGSLFKSQTFYSLQPTNPIPSNLSERIRQLYTHERTWIFIAALLLQTRNNFKCINKNLAKHIMYAYNEILWIH